MIVAGAATGGGGGGACVVVVTEAVGAVVIADGMVLPIRAVPVDVGAIVVVNGADWLRMSAPSVWFPFAAGVDWAAG